MEEVLKWIIVSVSIILIATTLSVLVLGVAGIRSRRLRFSQVFWRMLAACVIAGLLYSLLR